jgi:hypothetical protein
MSTHIYHHLKAERVVAEMHNGNLVIELRGEGNDWTYLNITGEIVEIARKLGNPTVEAKPETVNA